MKILIFKIKTKISLKNYWELAKIDLMIFRQQLVLVIMKFKNKLKLSFKLKKTILIKIYKKIIYFSYYTINEWAKTNPRSKYIKCRV